MTFYDKAMAAVAVTAFAATGAVIGAGLAGVFQHPKEQHCQIEVYDDGSAEPICQPGWMPTRPINEWPIVRVMA